jgi:hypothetical protein
MRWWNWFNPFYVQWPHASLRQWLAGTVAFVALLLGFYLIFSWLYP